MTLEDKVHGFRLLLFRRAQELGNVSAACRELGVSRSLYYQLRERFVRYGADGLHPTRRRGRPGRPAQLDAAVERQIVALALSWPTWGPRQLSDQLALRGVRVAESTVYRALRRLGLGTRKERHTLDQYGRFQVTARGDNSQGLILRSSATNGSVGPHYEVHVAGGSEVRWEYVLDDTFLNRPDMCTLSSPIQDGEWFGARITGTGSATLVEVFVSATELGPDPGSWPPPTCSLTGDPATPVDTGSRVGVRSHTRNETLDTFMDNVCVGGLP